MSEQPKHTAPSAEAKPADAKADWAAIAEELENPVAPDPVLKTRHPVAPEKILKK